ncbi:MAG: hypothetical protein A3G39_02370 [Deltaproteobacteria bacterium RIFCSPLOWO2_12_FULL_43_16]|nr:MAG: hypothetical protein A2Z89_08635 [Deltaproteobacteria bacterium GWA2_43_19]OGQ12279.1 MAG: hypothetical protein A3D30_01590 [Deltaproteobacteria bacterium RIFCSPHIGHO2_02_FULL_43_33]OGQ61659.1 MAG: hypothetical protein A3G39_02370 [Deltaproteobacteria bacterium RIFCSPLOWO2_12_FULL_43_16]
MESPGEYLKREREIRGVSLEDISKATKIRVGILTALEKNDFAALPATPFTKGFIQAYCKHLGVDIHDAILRYEAYMRGLVEKETAAIQEKAEYTSKEKTIPLPIVIPLSPRSMIALAAIAFLLMGGGIYAILKRHAPSAPASSHSDAEVAKSVVEQKKEPPITPDGHTKQSNQPGLAVTDSPALKKEANKAKVPQPVDTVSKEPLTLIIEATKPTWVRAEVDGKSPFEVSLREGEKVKWNAKEIFSVLIGNAGGVTVVFNGNQLGRLGDEGKVVKLTLPGVKGKDATTPNVQINMGDSTHP